MDIAYINRQIRSEIRNWSYKNFGYFDDYLLPPALNFENFGGGKIYIENPDKPLDCLWIFSHSGVLLPEEHNECIDLSDLNKQINLVKLNYDIGTRQFIQQLFDKSAEEGENPDSNIGIAMFEISRTVIDGNRLTRHEQLSEKPYRGGTPWKTKPDKKLAEIYLDPFTKELLRIVEKQKPKVIFHPHTYDSHGGGNASSNHENGTADERPYAMIFKHYSFEENAFGIYKPAPKKVEGTFLNDSQTITIRENLNAAIEEMGGKANTTVDYPYTSPVMLPVLFSVGDDIANVVVELRKDLLTSHKNVKLAFDTFWNTIKLL